MFTFCQMSAAHTTHFGGCCLSRHTKHGVDGVPDGLFREISSIGLLTLGHHSGSMRFVEKGNVSGFVCYQPQRIPEGEAERWWEIGQ